MFTHQALPQNDDIIVNGTRPSIVLIADEHTKNARPSTLGKHEQGQARRGIDRDVTPAFHPKATSHVELK